MSMSSVEMAGETGRYAGRLRALHWLIAGLMLATWPLGQMIGFVKDDVKLHFYLVHESLGFLVLWLMLLRIRARLTSKAPSFEAPPLEKAAAHIVHGLLYVFLIVMPVSGFLATNAHGFPLNWFGLITVWSPIGKAPDIAFALSAIHTWSAWILLALFAFHCAAVIFHHVVRRDPTLYRIL